MRKLVEKALDADKAENIVTIDLAGKSSLADYMIVASGTSQRHLTTLADHLKEKLQEHGTPVLAVEGRETSDWVVVDAGDILVHLFKPEARQLYNLEKMWAIPLPALEAAL